MHNDVFVLGSFVVDAAYRSARQPRPGETLIGSSFRLGPGGKGSNQAVAAARAGAQVSLQTSIGTDAFAEVGLELWRTEKIDLAFLKRSTRPTGSAAIFIDEKTGENAIIVVPGACDDLSPDDVEAAKGALVSSKVLLTQLEVPLATVQRGLQLARAAGVITILNPAPAQALPPEILQYVDYLIPNESEAATLTGIPVDGSEQTQHVAEALLGAGCRRVVLTLGAQGSLLCDEGGQRIRIPAVAAGAVVDTTGAGDAFCGAFAAALARGQQAGEAAHFASAAAGVSVTRHGTAPSMPTRAEVDRLLGDS